MKKVAIEHISYVEAPEVLTSKELEAGFIKKFGFEEGFLETLTGVKERRVWEPGKSISDIATLSAKKCIEESGVDKNEIGCIINCSVSLDFGEPALAIVLHDNLGLNHKCMSFDISNACMGFTVAVNVIENMIKTNSIKYGLIVAGESSRDILLKTADKLCKEDANMDKLELSLAALTLGSGSVSMLLTDAENSRTGHIINGSAFLTDSHAWKLCVGDLDRSELRVKARDMIKEGVGVLKEMKEYSQKVIPNWSVDDVDLFIPHQVSDTHSNVLSNVTGIPYYKLYFTYPLLGNVGPASWPISLYLADKGLTLDNNHIGILSMGSGFTISCMSVLW